MVIKMDRNIHITNPNDIGLILDVIHDCWFDKGDIVFDPNTAILSIRFKRELRNKRQITGKSWGIKKAIIPVIECFLRIHNIENYSVSDKANVGSYDFNEIKYDHNIKKVIVTTGVPIDIEIIVKDFEISIEETDNVIEEKKSISLW